MTTSNDGMFWHVHHDVLIEWSNNIQERIRYIKASKPGNEIAVRLKLLKKVGGQIPKELKEADRKWQEAYRKRQEADRKWKEAYRKWKEANQKWKEAYRKRKEAYQKHLPAMEELHKKECNCKEWNGKELVFA